VFEFYIFVLSFHGPDLVFSGNAIPHAGASPFCFEKKTAVD
jgi:hypothetical protein